MQVQNENETAVEDEIQSIDFVFVEANCFSDTDGIDVYASMEKLIELTDAALREAFPGCGEIEVSSEQSGMRCKARVFMCGDECPDSFVVAVEEIAANVWEKRGNDWIVFSDEDEDEDEVSLRLVVPAAQRQR